MYLKIFLAFICRFNLQWEFKWKWMTGEREMADWSHSTMTSSFLERICISDNFLYKKRSCQHTSWMVEFKLRQEFLIGSHSLIMSLFRWLREIDNYIIVYFTRMNTCRHDSIPEIIWFTWSWVCTRVQLMLVSLKKKQ